MNTECISCIKPALFAHLDEGEAVGYRAGAFFFSPPALLNLLPSEVMNLAHASPSARLRILMRWEDCKEKQDREGFF